MRLADDRFPNSTAEAPVVGASEERAVQEHSRQDRTWDHWPGRGLPDDGLRHRLRALFAATDDEAVEALIDERGREVEEQAARLQATIEGLERREEQAARLRSAVEEMLRLGSAELDERQGELTALAAEIREQEVRLQARAHEIEERKRELGAVELRRAAVERREEAARQRETELEAAAAELRRRELELRDLAGELERARQGGTATEVPAHDDASHLLYLADERYRLVEREGAPPGEGTNVWLDEKPYTVLRVGRSLLPGDRRACVYLGPSDATEPETSATWNAVSAAGAAVVGRGAR